MFSLLSTTPAVIADIVVILIILAFAAIACMRGFMKCLIGFVGTVLSVVLALLLCKVLSSFLQDAFGWLTSLSNFFAEQLSNISGLNVVVSSTDELDGFGVPQFIVSTIAAAFSGGEEIPAGTTMAQLVAPVLAQLLLNIISFLIIFLLIKLLCFILDKTLGDFIKRVPIIKSVNAILGFAVGAIEAIFFLCGILSIVALFPVDALREFIDSTTIMKFFYNNNLAGMLFNLVISSSWVSDFVKTIA